MLIVTDLADWRRNPLDSLAETPPVKPRLKKSDRSMIAALENLFAADCEYTVGETPAAIGGWSALAVVANATGSQYDALLDLARTTKKLPGPLAAVALTGRGFHGNRGRPWRAEPGNLHLSCTLPVNLDAVRCAAGVPALPAVAVCDALAACAPDLAPRIKWVNDVLIDDGKIAGVLAAAQSRGARLTSLVYGVGVNLAVAPAVEPTLFVPRVTCLRNHAAGSHVDLGDLCSALLEALWRRLEELRAEGSAPLVAAYRDRCGDVGRRVRVWAEGLPDTADPATLPAPVVSGRVLRLDDDLALHVEGAIGPLVGGRLAYHDDPEPTT